MSVALIKENPSKLPRRPLIPEDDRDVLHNLFNDLGYSYGAEIGVGNGKHAAAMFDSIPDLKLLLVDPWDSIYKNPSSRKGDRTPENAQSVFEKCCSRLDGRNTEYMRMTSIRAVEKVEDVSLDFVYIDGVHYFDYVMMDIICWTPKVRIGGIVSGHDYCHRNSFNSGVVRAVGSYASAHGINGLLVTNSEPRSWFWIRR